MKHNTPDLSHIHCCFVGFSSMFDVSVDMQMLEVNYWRNPLIKFFLTNHTQIMNWLILESDPKFVEPENVHVLVANKNDCQRIQGSGYCTSKSSSFYLPKFEIIKAIMLLTKPSH
jgi:hypothetical protein